MTQLILCRKNCYINTTLCSEILSYTTHMHMGKYTNTFTLCRNPVACGITSLGYDHTDILGDTLEQIAWQKGGIFKPGHPAFTVSQEPGPLQVLADRAKELKVLRECHHVED